MNQQQLHNSEEKGTRMGICVNRGVRQYSQTLFPPQLASGSGISVLLHRTYPPDYSCTQGLSPSGRVAQRFMDLDAGSHGDRRHS